MSDFLTIHYRFRYPADGRERTVADSVFADMLRDIKPIGRCGVNHDKTGWEVCPNTAYVLTPLYVNIYVETSPENQDAVDAIINKMCFSYRLKTGDDKHLFIR